MTDAASHAPSIAAIVLAAGLSSRMGRNKLLLEVDGQALVRHVVQSAVASEARPVFVVTGNQADEVQRAIAGLPVTFVHNPDFRLGLSASLKAGVTALPASSDGALVLLGDMPAITAAIIDRMIAAFNPGEDRAICVATHRGNRGNPVLWDRRFFADILVLEGDVGAKHLIATNEELVCDVESGDDAPLADIDTPEALASWLRRSAQ
jgi:molybdenum cofactor cytidylyltransferase